MTSPSIEPDKRPGTVRRRVPGTLPGLRLDYLLLWVVALSSLLLNVLILRQLTLAWGITRQAVNDALVVVQGFEGERFSYTVKVEDTIRINTTLPVQATIPVVVEDTLPINTVVTVPFSTPLGSFPINVPIVATVPVSLETTIPLDQSFPVDVSVPIALEVPVEIAISETPLASTLDEIERSLLALSKRLETPLPGLPGTQPETPDAQ
ncbi:MAG: hypothetical protein Kow00124_13900 [Anaerolineae bacterium]